MLSRPLRPLACASTRLAPPSGVRGCLLGLTTAPVTLTNVDFVNCYYAAVTLLNTNITMTGAPHTVGVALGRAGTPAAARPLGTVLAAGSHGVTLRAREVRGQSPSLNVMRAGTPATGGSVKGTIMNDSSALFFGYGYSGGSYAALGGNVAFKGVTFTGNVRGDRHLGLPALLAGLGSIPSCPRTWAKT